MDAGAPASSTVSAASTRMTSRKHPMHTCVVSLIALGHIVFAKSQGFDGRIGSVMKRVAAVAKLIAPFLRAIQYIWLAFLSFFDGYILAVENLIETIFPSSAHLFDKIDEFIQVVEVLPRKLDDMIVHQTPVLDFALVLAISWLNFFVSLLTSEHTKEKEIKIDVNYEGIHAESRSLEEAHEFAESPSHVRNENLEKFPPLSYTPEAGSETDESTAKADATNFSYGKEVLEKGKQEKVENEGGDEAEEENVKTEENDAVKKVSKGKEANKIDATEDENDAVDEVSKGEEGNKIDAPKDENDTEDKVSKGEEGNKIDAAEDAILKLFEDSWHMTPRKRR